MQGEEIIVPPMDEPRPCRGAHFAKATLSCMKLDRVFGGLTFDAVCDVGFGIFFDLVADDGECLKFGHWYERKGFRGERGMVWR